jgi:hypothetical protein
MALDKAAEWKAQADRTVLDRLTNESPPDTYPNCRTDANWHPIFYKYAVSNLANENLDFLSAVAAYRANADAASARKLYDDYVKPGAPQWVNLYDATQGALDDLFGGGDQPNGADIFDDASTEVIGVVDQDLYPKFKTTASNVRKELQAEAGGEEEEEEGDEEPVSRVSEVAVSRPTAIAITKADVNAKIVDDWNEEALKSLPEGRSAAFYEIDELVIIDAGKPAGVQPYLAWAEQHDAITPGATITLTKKGGAFDPGKIKAVGVQDTASFEAAIKRISKKKVEY